MQESTHLAHLIAYRRKPTFGLFVRYVPSHTILFLLHKLVSLGLIMFFPLFSLCRRISIGICTQSEVLGRCLQYSQEQSSDPSRDVRVETRRRSPSEHGVQASKSADVIWRFVVTRVRRNVPRIRHYAAPAGRELSPFASDPATASSPPANPRPAEASSHVHTRMALR